MIRKIAQVNAGILFNTYDIFIDKNYNKLLSFKYFKMASQVKNVYATLQLADFYYYG